jgi:acyl carrier protein
MRDKIKQIMSAIFDVPVDEITDSSSPDTIEKWDSLNHLNLVSSLEEEFDVRFSDEEITEMLNFQLIILILEQKKQ